MKTRSYARFVPEVTGLCKRQVTVIYSRGVLRNRLLLPEGGIAPDIVKGDEDALRLLKTTGAGSLGEVRG